MRLRTILRTAIPMALMSSVVLIGTTVSPANAADPCNSTVFDGAKVLGSNIGKVQDAADALRLDGADVRVVTVSNGQTTDTYEDQLLQQCSDWGKGPNGMKSSLVLFLVTIKPNSLLFDNGAQFDPYFTDGGAYSRNKIQGTMFGPMHAGDIAGGLVAGINLVKQGIDNNGAAPQNNSGSSGSSSAVPVVGIIVGFLLAIVLLGLAVWWLVNRKRDHDRLMTQRQRALSARDGTVSILDEVGRDGTPNDVARKIKVEKYAAAGDAYGSQLRQALQEFNESRDAATNGVAAAAAAGSDADQKDLTVGVYQQLAERYEQTLDQAQAAKDANQKINDIVTEIEGKVQQVSASILQADTTLAAHIARVTNLNQQGIKTDSIQGPLDDAKQTLDQAKQTGSDLSVLATLDLADAHLQRAGEELDELDKNRSALQSGLPALEARIGAVTTQIDPAAECFKRISDNYVESSWESVKGNGTEAMNRIHAAGEALADAKDESGLDKQDWNRAMVDMQHGNDLLDEAESLLRSITALETNLANAKQQAPSEIDAAKADIEKAESYLQQYSGDVDPGLTGDLRQAQDMLEQARDELAKDRPDYLVVVKLALQANHSADSIFEEAADDHEKAERLRRQAAAAVTQATAAISKAEEFIEDHAGDVGRGANQQLNDARAYLQKAQSQSDAADVLRNAEAAEEAADNAYDKAYRKFQDAEQAREEARRAAEQARIQSSVIIGSSYGSSHHSGGGGSWGSPSINIGGGGHHGGGMSFGGGGGGGHHGGGIGF